MSPGLAAVIVAIMGLLVGRLPAIGPVLGALIGITAIVFGVSALHQRRSMGMAIVGIGLGIAALMIPIGVAAGQNNPSADKPAGVIAESASPKAEETEEEVEPEKEAGGPTVGVPFEVKQKDGTAKITIVSATYGPTLEGPFNSEADNGGYLVLDVLWETADGVSSANPLYFKAKDDEGRKGGVAIGVENSLGSGEVPVGDKTRGNVAFDIGNGPFIVTVTDQLLREKARLTIDAE